MADDPENLTLRHFLRIDERTQREYGERLVTIERAVAGLRTGRQHL